MEKLSVATGTVDFDEYMKTDGNSIIWSVIRKFGKAGIDPEEAFQELSVALWKAYQAYKPGANAKVSTFVYQSVYNQMKMMIRSASTEKRITDRQNGSVDDHRNLHSSINVEAECIDRLIMESRANALHWAIKTAGLTPSERLVIQRTLKDCSQFEIAEELHVSQSHVSTLKKNAVKKIKECLLDAHWDGEGIRCSITGG